MNWRGISRLFPTGRNKAQLGEVGELHKDRAPAICCVIFFKPTHNHTCVPTLGMHYQGALKWGSRATHVVGACGLVYDNYESDHLHQAKNMQYFSWDYNS